MAELCERCGDALKYSRKKKEWYCPTCLLGSFLSDEAQKAAYKRYRQSPKGKASQKKWEESKKGKAARNKYLKSAKYRQRRKEYNDRLKESLRIARLAGVGRGERERLPIEPLEPPKTDFPWEEREDLIQR